MTNPYQYLLDAAHIADVRALVYEEQAAAQPYPDQVLAQLYLNAATELRVAKALRDQAKRMEDLMWAAEEEVRTEMMDKEMRGV